MDKLYFFAYYVQLYGKQYYLANTYCIQNTEHEKIQI